MPEVDLNKTTVAVYNPVYNYGYSFAALILAFVCGVAWGWILCLNRSL